ncbi:MAG: hypothetical protein IJT30_00575 [Muribaculaceae bacterium]|nr:hypothetical protein [Muribaculaceae bacterium]
MMNEETEMRQLKDDLRLIERTRLLRNTNAELGALVDYPLDKGNSLTRKGGNSLVMKRAVLSLLAEIAHKESGLNLNDVLAHYRTVDALLTNQRVRVRGIEAACAVARHYFFDTPLPPKLSSLARHITPGELPVLMLMLLEVLPQPSENSGDVKDFATLYERVVHTLTHVLNNTDECTNGRTVALKTIPALSRIDDDYRRGEINSRLSLIAITNLALQAFYHVLMPHLSLEENLQMCREMVFPDGIGDLYGNEKRDTQFWRVERVENAYFLYHYHPRREQRQLHYTRFMFKLFSEPGGKLMALVTHPLSMVDIIAGRPVDERHYAFLDCVLLPDGVLSFVPRVRAFSWFTRIASKLIPLKGENPYRQMFKKYELIDAFAEAAYDFEITLQSITCDAIVLGDGDGGTYTVPKRLKPTFDAVDFNQSIGVLKMAGTHLPCL